MAFCAILFWLPGAGYGEVLEEQRHDFLKAEAALNSGDRVEYQRLLKGLEGYPLLVYLRYQELSRGLNDSAVIAYLDRYEGSRYAKLLRNKFLLRLAAEGRWRKFIEFYQEDDSLALQCDYYRALYATARKSQALRGARSLWLSGETRPEECNSLFAMLRNSTLFSPDLAWQRFALALDKGNEGLAKYLQGYLAPRDLAAARFARRVHNNPALIATCPAPGSTGRFDAWIFAHGIERLAAEDLVRAVSLWDARSKNYVLDRQTLDRVNRRLAMLAALRRHPFAYSRFARLDSESSDQDARFWRIRSALTAKRWDWVLDSIAALPESERSELKWKYWQARALAAEGRKDRAERLFQELARERDYYGFLAADRMHSEYRYSERPIELDASGLSTLEASPQFAVIQELVALGRDAEAKRNWWAMLGALNLREKRLAAKVAEKWGFHQLAVFTAAKAEYWDDLRLRFPVLFSGSILRNAKEKGLPPAAVFGLVRQESVFDETVVSAAGAIGLMQIMPATGRRIAREINEPWRSRRKLFDAETNLRYGTHYLKGLLDRFGQNLALAAAGYNAGPHRVQSWLPVGEPLASDLWVEIIPYRETRRYVRYVLGYTVIYQHRLHSVRNRLRDFMPKVAPGNSPPQAGLPRAERFACR
ncbi:MAG: transglycosylase SLT domain-containing protein [Gammaproteobacteria bacterium]